MILPITQKRPEQVRTPQDGRITRCFAAKNDMIAAAGAAVPAIEHELLGPQTGLPGFFV